MEIFKKTEAFDTYWKFAYLRQEAFLAKNHSAKVTSYLADPIISAHRFTNCYRALDRVSQFLIKDVIYREACTEEDTIFRILLFKFFNKIETWRLLTSALDGDIRWSSYSREKYDAVLSDAIDSKARIYSAAYIMPSGKSVFGHSRKHRNNLSLIEHMMQTGITTKIAQSVNLEDIYNVFLSYPTIGPFLAYQFAIDVAYSELTTAQEHDFVMPGPGAKDGIAKCFSGASTKSGQYIIEYMCDQQEAEFERLSLDFKWIKGRKLQLIDCQNLFCEVDKYCRVYHPDIAGISGRTRIKQKYKPNHSEIDLYFPPKWGVIAEF